MGGAPPTQRSTRRSGRVLPSWQSCLALLLGGLVVNVLMAWYCAGLIASGAYGDVIEQVPSRGPAWIEPELQGFDEAYSHDADVRTGFRSIVYCRIDRRTGVWRYAGVLRAGLPMRSLEGYWKDDVPANAIMINCYRASMTQGGIWIDLPRWVPLWVPRNLLYRPIWAGFLANTLFYAMALGILLAVARALRRWIASWRLVRRRRGRDLCDGREKHVE